MTGKTIFDAVHETAKGPHKAGATDAITMRELDAFCLPFVKTLQCHADSEAAIALEGEPGAVFAAYLHTSPSTDQRWEQHKK